MRTTRAFVAGAAAAYLLPRLGRRRRHALRDRALSLTRRGRRLTVKKTRFLQGRLRGVWARTRRTVERPPVAVDDATIVQRIRSDALRDVGVSTHDVDVEVEDGVATIRGSLERSAHADELVGRVAKVPGVRDVAAILRVREANELR